jgi:hypothetical protein
MKPLRNITDALNVIRARIAELNASKSDAITIASLEQLLSAIEIDVTNNPPAEHVTAAIENTKLRQAYDLTIYAEKLANARMMFKSVITTAIAAGRAAMLMNGGGAVALLAFIGHVASTGINKAYVSQLSQPLAGFLTGVLFAGLFSGLFALAQRTYTHDWKKTGHFIALACILCGFASLIMFAIAAWCGAHVLQNFPNSEPYHGWSLI